jgi:uncharacterized membrane protein YuzA (DUF378 family)
MKNLKCLTTALLVVGGLNWGLVAAFELDLVAMLLGQGSVLARVVYGAVALSAVYELASWWGCCNSNNGGCCR